MSTLQHPLYSGEEYDPSRPNDYDRLLVLRKKKKQDERNRKLKVALQQQQQQLKSIKLLADDTLAESESTPMTSSTAVGLEGHDEEEQDLALPKPVPLELDISGEEAYLRRAALGNSGRRPR